MTEFNKEDIVPERPDLPENVKGTEAHIIIDTMGLVATKLNTIKDLETGEERVKKFGAYLALNIVPKLNEQTYPGAPVLLPRPPATLIVGDNLTELRERLKFEIDVMLDTTQDVMDGKYEVNEAGQPVLAKENTDATNIHQGPTPQ